MARHQNTPPKKNSTPPITDPKKIDKLQKQREATKRCRENKKKEFENLQERKKTILQENERLKSQIEEIRKLILWMQRATTARAQQQQ